MDFRNRLSTTVASAAFLLSCQSAAPAQTASATKPDAPQCSAPDTTTSSGTVCGLSVSGGKIHAYLGIPYGQSTAGAKRWSPPVPVAKPHGKHKATAFGPVCPQAADKSPFPQNEDCLSLNLWTPRKRDGAGLPVMVFIHGGSFTSGSGANPLYNGSSLAARGVVVVTLNYRIGALGFLAGIEGLTGNYGFLDQQLALKWVRDNIAGFGGDPDKVTIFGESAGAMSVGLHLQSPESRPLFRAAIMESNPFGMPFKSMSEAGRFGGHFRSAVGCRNGGLDCLRRAPKETLVQRQKTFWIEIESLLSGFSGQLVWAPVVDGQTVPGQANENRIAVPVIAGTNRDEGVIFANFGKGGFLATNKLYRIKYEAAIALLFSRTTAAKVRNHPSYRPVSGDNTGQFSNLLNDYLFTCPNRHVLGRAQRKAFAYHFTHVPSYDAWPQEPACAPEREKVCHTFELPYVFNQPTTIYAQLPPVRATFTAAEKAMSERMGGYWTRFASALNPNSSIAPPWPEYTQASPRLQILDTQISSGNGPDANCAFWDGIGYDLPGFYDRLHGYWQELRGKPKP